MDDSTTVAAPDPKPVKPAKKRSPKKPSTKRIRLQLYFAEDVRLQLEHYCIDQRVTMSDYVNALVAKHLPKRKAR